MTDVKCTGESKRSVAGLIRCKFNVNTKEDKRLVRLRVNLM